jgi:hypothetical protein
VPKDACIKAVTLAIFQRSMDVLLATTATLWVFIATRLSLLTLIDVSAFSPFSRYYLMPVLYFSVAATGLRLTGAHDQDQ